MSQKIINVGTVANDGTGDTIRGAFSNVNANFTEVYGNLTNLTATVSGIDLGQNTTIIASYNTANAAFIQANTANAAAFSIGSSVGVGANSYATGIGASSNSYAVAIGASSNAYTDRVGTAANSLSTTMMTAGNNYAAILSANNALGANNWSNTLTLTTYAWANAKFDTVTNTTYILTVANAAFERANSALPNTGNNLILYGNLSVTGSYTDAIGPLREKPSQIVNSNVTIQTSRTVVIANNSNTIYIKIVDDQNFSLLPNIGSSIEIYQFGSGQTAIRPNTSAVNIYSSNNWANIAGQYLTVSLIKVQSNTWVLTGNLKA